MNKLLYFPAVLLLLFLYSCTREAENIQADPQLKIEKVDLVLMADAGGLDSFTVHSNIEWKVSPSTATWFRLDIVSAGEGKKVIATAVQKNTTGVARVATFIISAVNNSEVQPVTVTVTQLATTTTSYLAISDTLIMLDGKMGSSDTFSIQSNINWTVAHNSFHLSITPMIGSGNATISVTAHTGSYDEIFAKGPVTVTVAPVGDSTVRPLTLTVKMVARPITTLWSKIYGGSEQDEFRAIAKAPDGGFVMAGSTYSNNGDVSGLHAYKDMWVVKVDGNGNKVWQRTLGGSGQDAAWSVAAAQDGGFVVAGYTYSADGDVTGYHGNGDMWVVKLNSAGNIVWQRALGGSRSDEATSVAATADGGFIIAGMTMSSDGDVSRFLGNSDSWVVKLDGAGNLLWENSYGGADHDKPGAIAESPQGGYYLAISTDTATWNFNPYLYRLDPAGKLVWKEQLARSTDLMTTTALVPTKDGGCITVFNSQTGTGDYVWYHKYSSAGTKVWHNLLTAASPIDQAFCITASSDGGFVLAGYTRSEWANTTQGRIFKIGANSSIQWSKQFGGQQNDFLYGIVEAEPGSYVATGYSNSNNGDFSAQHGWNDGWILKVKD